MFQKRFVLILIFQIVLALTAVPALMAWQPLPVVDDPLVRMPGTQPDDGVTLEGPGRCLNCHAGYNQSVEPGFNWKGSMMAQASRDFLFWSCMTVAMQDAIWAVGNPNATDICIRCHFPIGWIEGRSDPTNATLMGGDDYDGVNCDFCHQLYDPFYVDTFSGAREGSDWVNYWDEQSSLSGSGADATYAADAVQAATVTLFNGGPFFGSDGRPVTFPTYKVNGGGQYFVSAGGQKRGPFVDDEARHQSLYSRYHKSKYFCSTCHDISNPILANAAASLGLDGPPDQSDGEYLITEQYPSWQYFHVERTFSEFMLSAYGQQGGAPGIGPFDPGVFETSFANNNIAKCQDCHLRDVVGVGCNKKGAPVRPDGSAEHPESALPLHDMTGGNAWVSWVLASAMPGSPNFNQTNSDLLYNKTATLTMDLMAGNSADPAAILAGSERSKQQLLLGASINEFVYTPASGAVSFKVQNQTGHKLISGFPEGRRMFINIKAYTGGSVIYEVNPYDNTIGTLKGLTNSQSSPPLGDNEVYVDELVYEAHTSSSLTGEDETFHFALATDRYKDNRIPPKGFRMDGSVDDGTARLSQPRWHGADAPGYFTAAEYAGGYDDVSLAVAAGADYVEVNLYYQTTSREYMEFLRDEINGIGGTLSSPTPSGEPQAYIAQTDPFFAQVRAWGDTLWQLWLNNKDVDGAAPFLMTQSTWGTPSGGGCTDPAAPSLDPAVPGNSEVTLYWSSVTDADGYRVYYDQADKGQFVADIEGTTTFTDTGLTNGAQYCYKVSAYSGSCESVFSNIECAIPNNQSQASVGVASMAPSSPVYAPGDLVVVGAYVVDGQGAAVAGATVDVSITGPENNNFTSGPSDAAGYAEVIWQTKAGNRKGKGATRTGSYTATTTGVTASGYQWDGVTTNTSFDIQ
jgi:hypothetical protein